MKGVSVVIQAVLIFGIIAVTAAAAFPWANNYIQRSMDLLEINKVKDEFSLCNDKLVETARTGTANKCYFTANRGNINAQEDGLYYRIISNANICDEHWWTNINPKAHLWQKCDRDISKKILEYKWYYPKDINITGQEFYGNIIVDEDAPPELQIYFDSEITFMTLSVIIEFDFTEGQSGNLLEIGRVSIDETKTVLNVKLS